MIAYTWDTVPIRNLSSIEAAWLINISFSSSSLIRLTGGGAAAVWITEPLLKIILGEHVSYFFCKLN